MLLLTKSWLGLPFSPGWVRSGSNRGLFGNTVLREMVREGMANPPVAVEQETQVALDCAHGLEAFGRAVVGEFSAKEKDFLRLGALLAQFSDEAMAVSRQAAELTSLTSGETVQETTSLLSENLKRLRSGNAGQDNMDELVELEAIASVGGKLTEIIREFSRLVKHLSMLGIATRIESARLGSSGMGFATLSDDVEKLALKIVSASENILHRAHELTVQTKAAGESLRAIHAAQKGSSLATMEQLHLDLHALEQLSRKSRESAGEISGLAQIVGSSVSEAVHSMQFHDIIRQQLEHVDEATSEVRTQVLDLPDDERLDPDEVLDVVAWMHGVLSLQRSQLGNARARFAEAMQDLDESLRTVASQVEQMADMAGSLGAQGANGVLSQIENGVAGVAASLREQVSLGGKMATVMKDVADSIREMSTSVFEIEEVGSEIELIAINASIKAAHTGEEGKALGVLASAIQKLSVDARTHTEQVLELLKSVDQSSEALHSASVSHSSSEAAEPVIAELLGETEQLKDLDTLVAARAEALRRAAGTLNGEILNAVESLEFRHPLIDAMAMGEARLHELVDQVGPYVQQAKGGRHSAKLKEMLKRYTMEAERLVHENVLGGGVASLEAAHAGDTAVSDDPDGLGDNIELF